MWVEAAGLEGVSLSEWLRRAATARLAVGLLVSGAPPATVVTTPGLGGRELEEAWGSVSPEVLEEIRVEWDEGADLAQDEGGLGSAGAGIVSPTGYGQDKPVPAEPNQPGPEAQQEGTEETGKATPPLAEGLVTPISEPVASVPQAGVGETDPAVSVTGRDEPVVPPSSRSNPTPETKPGTESELGALVREAREMLGKPFKGPDPKPQPKKKR